MRKEKKCTQAQFKSGLVVIKIIFPPSLRTVKQVKSLNGLVHHPNGGFWTCPLTISNLEKLMSWNFQLDKKLRSFFSSKKKKLENIPPIKVDGLRGGELMPFQEEGVAFMEHLNGRALIADEMGLGKTIQAIAYLQLHPELRPAVIIVPKLVKYKWAREAKKWLENPGEIQILEGKEPSQSPTGDIIILNYDILPNKYKTIKTYNPTTEKYNTRKVERPFTGWIDLLISVNPKIVITDECHYYKSNSANRTKAIKKIGKVVPHFLALSGTPIENRPIEIYNAVNIINPKTFPNYMKFARRYCAAKHNGFGWNMNGASNIPELHGKLHSLMIRRKKKDVLKELPDKSYSHVPFEITNRTEYNQAEDNFIKWVTETQGKEAAERKSGAEVLTKMNDLKQLAVKGKMEAVIEWIKEFFENSDEKLVVFAWHRTTIDTLIEAFPGISVKVDGSVTDKDKVIARFQKESGCRLFVGQIVSAGVGIELTAASNVAIVELPWKPGTLDQAIDRTHRIGQTKGVMVNYLLANDTIEDKLAELIDVKRNVVSQVLDGIEAEDSELISELIAQMIK